MSITPPLPETVDLIIVGSGVGGLTAAIRAHDLGLECVVVEKSGAYGGSSAMSGGTLWVPCNHLQAAAGVEDDPEQAWRYVESLSGGEIDAPLMRAFLDEAPKVIAELERTTPLRFEVNALQPDYHPELPGGLEGGRSLNARRFDGRRLGATLYQMRESHPQTLVGGRIGITPKEARALLSKSWASRFMLLKLLLTYLFDVSGRRRGTRDRRLVMGNGLIGPLRLALLERGVPVVLDTAVEALIVEGGRVVGVSATRDGEPCRIDARRGVLLAAGGFAGDQALRERYLPQPTAVAWSAANRHNTGDALRMGTEVGAAAALLDQAWWTPTVVVPGRDLAWIMVVERSRPGCIVVDGTGRRFADEGLPYEPAVRAMIERHGPETPCVPAWLIFDARYRRSYPCGPVMPGYAQPDKRVAPGILADVLHRAPTLAALAERIGLPPDALEATVSRFNTHAAGGEDPDFGKGGSAYSRYYGDAAVEPNPCLRPLTDAPFYAVPVMPGDLGTKGGLCIDARARVLDTAGAPIAGLFATGNCTASVMGRTYPGAGATLAPSMTFGWIAASAAASADAATGADRGEPASADAVVGRGAP